MGGGERETQRKRAREERETKLKKEESQKLKENPTRCEEILVLMSFPHLPHVFSPGYPTLRL